jgi:hypothetical protein
MPSKHKHRLQPHDLPPEYAIERTNALAALRISAFIAFAEERGFDPSSATIEQIYEYALYCDAQVRAE